MKKYNRNNPIPKNFIDTMDLLFSDEPATPVRQFKCAKCIRKHTMDLELYKQTIQVSRLVIHCQCGATIDVH